ncbi:hypothetical protein BC332_26212 [Capsicum chinense]|nr:hypothetical protein BC332_26212 [Capsicum chinense]
MGDSSTQYIHLVHHLIEECLLFNMSREECMEALSKHANILPVITSTVAALPLSEFISGSAALKYDFMAIGASILDDFCWGVLALRWPTCWGWFAMPKVTGALAIAAAVVDSRFDVAVAANLIDSS